LLSSPTWRGTSRTTVLLDHVFLALDTEIRDCVGRAECTVDEILRIIRESPQLEKAASSEADRMRRPGASYFVASENEDDEPVRWRTGSV
jgi:hypothetical protein